MKALVFGVRARRTTSVGPSRPTTSSEAPVAALRPPPVDDARPRRPDWVVTRPILAGICGSDAKLVLGDFGEGDIDNPMSAFSSLPHVPGHEVVAEVVELGPAAEGVEVGHRVVLNPWLTCGPAGHRPALPGLPGRRPEPVLELHHAASSARASTSA